MWARAFRRLFFLCFLLLSYGAASCVPTSASPTAAELVRDSLSAPYHWDFSGTQVIINWTSSGASVSTTVKVTHRKTGTTLVRYMNGSGRIVQDNGKSIRQYEPGYRTLLVDHRPSTPDPKTLFRLLSRSHKLTLVGTDRVCGRKAYVVLLVPRVPGNPWRKCWIDYYTKYTLKNEQYGPEWPKGAPQNFMFWSSISFGAVSQKSVELSVPSGTRTMTRPEGQLVVSLDQVQKLLGFRVLMPTNPPPGYVYDGANVVRIGSMKAVHVRFTNGLNAVSLFQSMGPIQPSALPMQSAQVVAWRQGSINVALVGNISRSELVALQRQISSRSERENCSDVSRRTGTALDVVTRLRDHGYGYRDIALALLAAHSTGQDASMLLRMRYNGFSWDEISQRYNFSLREITRKIQGLDD